MGQRPHVPTGTFPARLVRCLGAWPRVSVRVSRAGLPYGGRDGACGRAGGRARGGEGRRGYCRSPQPARGRGRGPRARCPAGGAPGSPCPPFPHTFPLTRGHHAAPRASVSRTPLPALTTARTRSHTAGTRTPARLAERGSHPARRSGPLALSPLGRPPVDLPPPPLFSGPGDKIPKCLSP